MKKSPAASDGRGQQGRFTPGASIPQFRRLVRESQNVNQNQQILVADAPPPPTNPYWHRFANNVIGYQSLVASYLAAGFQCTKATAYVNASKLRRKPVVAEYIRYWLDREHQQRREESMKRDVNDLRIHL